jgi:hypothetical protein
MGWGQGQQRAGWVGGYGYGYGSTLDAAQLVEIVVPSSCDCDNVVGVNLTVCLTVLCLLVVLFCAPACHAVLCGHPLQLFRLITSMDSDNYPETCHAIYIVNGGVTFGAIWRIVSPFVDKGTRDKVHVVGSGKNMRVSACVGGSVGGGGAAGALTGRGPTTCPRRMRIWLGARV